MIEPSDATVAKRSNGRSRIVTVIFVLGAMFGVSLVVAPAASAEPSAHNATFTSCPALAVTCTRYWSVNRSKEFNNEEKAWVLTEYGVSAGLATLAAAAATSTVIGTPLGVAAGAGALYNAYKAGEFDVQLSSAANDGRCLIYKFPKGALSAGWWGNVSASTNDQCKKANEKDKDVFK